MIDDSLFDMIESTFSKEQLELLKRDLEYPSVYGVRFNPYKQTQLDEFQMIKSPLNGNVFIPSDYKSMVHHPFHHAGVYYIQDPSASIPVEYLDLKKDDVVLDMCAAPGGKSSQILSRIPDGFLIANEFDSKRNQRLQTNLGRWGVEHYCITQEDGRALSSKIHDCFDKVLLDAPCSGEGLIRRKKDYTFKYNPEIVRKYAELQLELLQSAYALVKNEGIIIYATCTLNTVENEEVVQAFLAQYPQCELVEINHPLKYKGPSILNQTARFFPSVDGEGQFMAKIKVFKNEPPVDLKFSHVKIENRLIESLPFSGCFKEKDNKLYGLRYRGYLNEPFNVTQDGIVIADIKKNRYDFNHNVSQSLSFKESFPVVECTYEEAYQYLHGQVIPKEIKGYCVISYQGLVLGLGKGNGKHINNRYPKHLRNKFLEYR